VAQHDCCFPQAIMACRSKHAANSLAILERDQRDPFFGTAKPRNRHMRCALTLDENGPAKRSEGMAGKKAYSISSHSRTWLIWDADRLLGAYPSVGQAVEVATLAAEAAARHGAVSEIRIDFRPGDEPNFRLRPPGPVH